METGVGGIRKYKLVEAWSCKIHPVEPRAALQEAHNHLNLPVGRHFPLSFSSSISVPVLLSFISISFSIAYCLRNYMSNGGDSRARSHS